MTEDFSVVYLYFLDLNENGHVEPWDLVTLETEEEFNLIRAGMGFCPAHYHGKYWHRGRTLVEPSAGAFGYSDYIPTRSLFPGIIFVSAWKVVSNYTLTLRAPSLHSYVNRPDCMQL